MGKKIKKCEIFRGNGNDFVNYPCKKKNHHSFHNVWWKSVIYDKNKILTVQIYEFLLYYVCFFVFYAHFLVFVYLSANVYSLFLI
jgi:hypothetical protein